MGAAAETGWDELLTTVHVHAWRLREDGPPAASAGQRPAFLDWLAPHERQHYGRLRTPALRRLYLAARVLCRGTLSRYAGVEPAAWAFTFGAHGKPAVAAPAGFESLRFNLTHTDGLVACAVTRTGEVGLDAEETSREVDVLQVARHFFSPAEQAVLAALPPGRRAPWFFEQWVLKEAYLKGRGTGLSEPPDGFTVERAEDGRPLPAGGWQLSLHRPTPRHAAAVAVAGPRDGGFVPVHWFAAED